MSVLRKMAGVVASVATVFLLNSQAALADNGPSSDTEWGGFYVGAHAGYGWGNRDGCVDVLDLNNACDGIIPPIPFDYDQKGWLAGGQFGYNHQIDQFVFGAEVEASFGDIDGTVGPLNSRGEYSWLGTAKLRAGWAFMDNLMAYATGGLAVAEFEYEGALGCSFDQTRVGWLVGGGAEYKVTERASVRMEYNYRNFGEESARCNVLAIIPTYTEADADMHVITFGFNYLLGRQ